MGNRSYVNAMEPIGDKSTLAGLTLIFQSTCQVGPPYVLSYLTFEIFTWQKYGIYA